MMKKYVSMGVLMAIFASASAAVYADDAQTQMNGQMGPPQAMPAAPAMPATTAATQNTNQPSQMGVMDDSSQTGNGDNMNMPPSPAPANNNN